MYSRTVTAAHLQLVLTHGEVLRLCRTRLRLLRVRGRLEVQTVHRRENRGAARLRHQVDPQRAVLGRDEQVLWIAAACRAKARCSGCGCCAQEVQLVAM